MAARRPVTALSDRVTSSVAKPYQLAEDHCEVSDGSSCRIALRRGLVDGHAGQRHIVFIRDAVVRGGRRVAGIAQCVVGHAGGEAGDDVSGAGHAAYGDVVGGAAPGDHGGQIARRRAPRQSHISGREVRHRVVEGHGEVDGPYGGGVTSEQLPCSMVAEGPVTSYETVLSVLVLAAWSVAVPFSADACRDIDDDSAGPGHAAHGHIVGRPPIPRRLRWWHQQSRRRSRHRVSKPVTALLNTAVKLMGPWWWGPPVAGDLVDGHRGASRRRRLDGHGGSHPHAAAASRPTHYYRAPCGLLGTGCTTVLPTVAFQPVNWVDRPQPRGAAGGLPPRNTLSKTNSVPASPVTTVTVVLLLGEDAPTAVPRGVAERPP